VDIAVV